MRHCGGVCGLISSFHDNSIVSVPQQQLSTDTDRPNSCYQICQKTKYLLIFQTNLPWTFAKIHQAQIDKPVPLVCDISFFSSFQSVPFHPPRVINTTVLRRLACTSHAKKYNSIKTQTKRSTLNMYTVQGFKSYNQG